MLETLKLPTLASELVPRFVAAGKQDVLPLLLECLELEVSDRRERRIERLCRASHLPPGKTAETLDDKRFPRALQQKLVELEGGDFLDRAVNVLCFGLPGVGKSHAACAIGHALVTQGRSVLSSTTSATSNRAPEEAEVLFTLMAERYERRSMLITSNLVFSQWERIFKNPLTTAAPSTVSCITPSSSNSTSPATGPTKQRSAGSPTTLRRPNPRRPRTLGESNLTPTGRK